MILRAIQNLILYGRNLIEQEALPLQGLGSSHNVSELKPLEYSDDKYCIIIPTKASDVVDEGAHLGHCVGSYVNRIVNGETNILFMRKVNEPEESLVTLEFKNNTLCQYKGYGDRPVTEEEDEFLTRWCKEKNIEKSERG